MPRVWTEEQRARQAELIRSWKPWTKSTGAKTLEGKAISSQNARIGKQNREQAILTARKELADAEEKLFRLTGRRGEWCWWRW